MRRSQPASVVMGPRLRGDDNGDCRYGWVVSRISPPSLPRLLLGRGALHEGLATLHLVRQWRLVDLDDDGVGVDPEIADQRLRDVAHHAGLLFVGAAGGHAHGDLRHFFRSLFWFLFVAGPVRAITRQ